MADKVCCRHSAGLALKGYSLPFWQITFPVYVLKMRSWDFPGGLEVKIPLFHCRGHRFDPWSGKKSLPAPWCAQKQNKTQMQRSPWERAVLLSISCHCHHLRKRCHVSNSDSSKVLGQHFVLTRIWQHLRFYQEQSMSWVLWKLSSRNFTPFHQA